jgi:hypothetical protein
MLHHRAEKEGKNESKQERRKEGRTKEDQERKNVSLQVVR